MTTTKRMDEIFPPEVLRRLIATFNRLQGHPGLHRELTAIIEENMPRINELVGHECDPDYLAFAVEFAASQPRSH